VRCKDNDFATNGQIFTIFSSFPTWFSKTYGLVQQNLWFGSTKPMVWFNKTYGFVQQNLWFGSTKRLFLPCATAKKHGIKQLSHAIPLCFTLFFVSLQH